jgi:hypothetical protein
MKHEFKCELLPFIYKNEETFLDILKKTKKVVRNSTDYGGYMKKYNIRYNSFRFPDNFNPQSESNDSTFRRTDQAFHIKNKSSLISLEPEHKIGKYYKNNPINVFKSKMDIFDNYNVSLCYENNTIFNFENYNKVIKKKIEELKLNKNQNLTFYLNKNFKNISLYLHSMSIEFINKTDKSVENIQFSLPFALLPVFYYSNIETFKLILAAIIRFDDELKKIIIKDDNMYYLLNTLKEFEEHEIELPKHKHYKFDWITNNYIYEVHVKYKFLNKDCLLLN